MKEKTFRVQKRLAVRYSTSAGAAWFEAHTVDLSRGGFFIISSREERPGSMVDIELRLPNGQDMTLYGTVAWAGPAPRDLAPNQVGFGVQLVDPPSEWAQLLDEWERRASRRRPPPLPNQDPAIAALMDDLDRDLDE